MDTIAVKKQSLAQVRTDLLMRQEDLVEASGVGIVTISRCENGNPITLLTAKKLLRALNNWRNQEGLEPLTIDDMDWQIV